MKPSTWLKILIVAALVALVGYFALDRLKPVAAVAPVSRGVAVRSVPGTVETRAALEMDLRSDLPGRVVDSRLAQGARVEEGETLMILDTRDVELEIEKATIELDATRRAKEMGSPRKFELAEAEEALENARKLFSEGVYSQADVDTRARRVDQIEDGMERELSLLDAKLAQLDNELKALARKKQKMTIVSPIAGVVTEIYANRGDLIDSGLRIARIISRDRIVNVEVSEENFAGLELGQLARVKFLGYGDEVFSGRVALLLPVADPATQRYTARLEMEMDEERLFPGLTGEATITIDERPGALVAPASALMGDNVFVVEGGVVARRQVQRGFGSLTSVEILAGLEEGDLLIVERHELFREGDRVRPETGSL